MCMKTGPCSFMILLTLILALPVRSQDQAVPSDSALRVQITTNGVALFNGEWFIEASGYQKRDSTEIDTVIIMRKKMKIRVVADRLLERSPARVPVIDSMERALLAGCGKGSELFSLEIYSNKRNIRDYVPGVFQSSVENHLHWFVTSPGPTCRRQLCIIRISPCGIATDGTMSPH